MTMEFSHPKHTPDLSDTEAFPKTTTRPDASGYFWMTVYLVEEWEHEALLVQSRCVVNAN